MMKVVYFGTPVESMQYLRQLKLACPDGYNAADHWMDLLVTDSAVEEERLEQRQEQGDGEIPDAVPQWRKGDQNQAAPRFQLQEAWDNEAVAEQMDLALVTSSEKTAGHNSDLDVGNKYSVGWTTQYLVLTHRALKNSRSAIFTPLNLMKSVAIGVVAGLLWFQTEYTEKNVNDIRSYYFFTMTFWVFDSMFTALTAFPTEREVIMKERASGSYHLSAYFMAKTTSDAPVRLVLPLLYMTVSYWMIGVSDSFATFLASIGCTLLSVVAGESAGLLVGASILDMEKAITVMTVAMLFLMLLGGFFVENIPSFVSWAKFLSPFKYAFDSSLQLIFDHDVPCDGSGALEKLCLGSSEGVARVDDVLDFIGLQGSLGFNVGMLVVLCFVPRYLAYVALRMQKGADRS
jgi:ABC-type multidrug transport system permease subunit